MTISLTFTTLLPLILTSKFVYGIFQARRDSIIHAIASNRFGAILLQALWFAWCEDAHLLHHNVENLPREDNIHIEITPAQARILTHNAQTVQDLEDYYSFR
jgi:hypothetical protein